MNSCSIPLLQGLEITKNEFGEGAWVEVDHFITFLRKHRQTTEKKIKRHNILSEFRGHHNALKEFNGILHVPFMSVLRYLFHHYDQQAICRQSTIQIQNLLKYTN